MDEIVRIKEIVSKPADELTAEDKQVIRTLAKRAGIKLPRKTACNSCWIDCAVEAFGALKSSENKQCRLRKGVNILYNGERVCAATCTDERVKRWIASGLPAEYFEE